MTLDVARTFLARPSAVGMPCSSHLRRVALVFATAFNHTNYKPEMARSFCFFLPVLAGRPLAARLRVVLRAQDFITGISQRDPQQPFQDGTASGAAKEGLVKWPALSLLYNHRLRVLVLPPRVLQVSGMRLCKLSSFVALRRRLRRNSLSRVYRCTLTLWCTVYSIGPSTSHATLPLLCVRCSLWFRVVGVPDVVDRSTVWSARCRSTQMLGRGSVGSIQTA